MTDERIRAYLLHELTSSETKEFEEQCFAQEEWPPTLECAEADLIDAYIRKELSPDRQRRFEENYLNTAARRERVLLARSFLRLVCAPEPKELNPRKRAEAFWTTGLLIPRVALRPVAIGLVLIVGALLSLWYLIPRAPQTFASVSLKMSESNRGEGEKERRANNIHVTRIGFPLTADALLLSFQLPEPSPEGAKYSVQWESVKNQLGPLEVVVDQEAKFLIVVIPATRLRPGQYNLKVFRSIHGGPEEPVNGNYFFDVESPSEHDANKGNQLP